MVKAATLEFEFVAEIAKLEQGLRQIKQGVNQTMRAAVREHQNAERAALRYADALEKEAAAIGKTARQIKQMEIAANAAAAEQAGFVDLARRIRTAGQAFEDVGQGASLARYHTQNLVFQFQDLGLQMAAAAQSSKPLQMAMMALVQQGSQISGIMMQAGIGVRGLASEVGGMIGRFALAHPILVGIGVAAGVAAGALKLVANSFDDGGGEAFARSLGLTEKEMKKLTDTGVTTGDVLRGLWKTIYDGLNLGPVFAQIRNWSGDAFGAVKRWAGDAFGFVLDRIKDFAAASYAAFAGTSRAMAALATAAKQALAGDLSGALATIRTIPQGYSKAFGDARTVMDGFFARAGKAAKAFGKEWRENTLGSRNDRLQAQAETIIADRAAKMAKADRDAARAARELEKAQRELQAAYDGILGAFMPIAAAEQAYMRALADVEKVKRAGMLTDAQAADAQMGALKRYIEALRAAREKEGLGLDIKLNIDTSQLIQDMSAFTTSIDEAIERVRRLGDNLSDAFGRGGNAVSRMMSTLAEYQKAQETIDNAALSADVKRQKSGQLQLDTLIGLTGAAKGLFSEHSKGYKAMVAAEQALTVVQLARTAVDVAGGAARMFATLGPLGFPAVAAMLGVMASLGFNSGASVKAPTTNQGTGTVFGDTSAKSDSIKRSIDLLADLDTEMLVVSRQMAASLKAIESNIGGLTNLVIRLGGVDGIGSNAAKDVNTGFKRDLLGTALEEGLTRGVSGFMGMAAGMLIAGPLGGAIGLALGALTDFTKKIPILGDILGGIGSIIGGLFGTKTKVVGSGIFGAPQTLADIDALGFTGQTFADIQKKKRFLGVTTSTKYSTRYGDLDASLEDQFGKLLLSFADAIKLAAGPLGLATGEVEAKLNAFVVNIGKIDLKGLSGEEIQEKLTAVFGQQADLMAQAVIDLQRFQKVGEGAFETLVRVASTVDVVTTSLQQLGLSSQSLGIDASMAIADLFGGAQDYATAANAYFEAFYSDAEQAAARAAQLGRVFDSLGVAMPDSIAAYRALVEAQDLTTAAGQQLYAQLLQLAPAFAEIVSAGKSAASAAAILRERQDLEKQLLELQGNTVALRQRELEQLDPSNRALQMQIWAIQDQQRAAQDAASAAKELADAWGSVGDSIMAEVKRIRGLDATAAASSYQTLAAQFNVASAAARRGDMDAAKALPELSRTLLDAAAGQVGSRRELDLIRGQTAASLELTYRSTEKMVSQQQAAADLASRALQVAVDQQGWWQSFADQQAAAADSSKAANDALVEELQGLRAQVATLAEDQRTIGATLAGNTGKTAKILDNVSDGGDTLRVKTEAA
ncbi:hypothetical protein EIK56_22945 [Sphingomonas sp. C8-2]|nr:hypothetical protein EIK56_22945 [Sphingomonas sp. C8-2]